MYNLFFTTVLVLVANVISSGKWSSGCPMIVVTAFTPLHLDNITEDIN